MYLLYLYILIVYFTWLVFYQQTEREKEIPVEIPVQNKESYNERYIDTKSYENVRSQWLYDFFDTVYVITIPARERYITRVMNTMKLNPVFLRGIIKHDLVKQDLVDRNLIHRNCSLNNGRIACHLSHIEVLKTFLKTNKKTCFVFEDDVKLPTNLQTTYKQMTRVMKTVPSTWDIINFSRCWDNCSEQVIVNDSVVKSLPLCRSAYAITRKCANIIVNETLPMRKKPGDVMYKELAEKGIIDIYASTPSLFVQNRKIMGSELGNTSTIRECRERDIGNRKWYNKLSLIVGVDENIQDTNSTINTFTEFGIVKDIIISNSFSRSNNISSSEKTLIVQDSQKDRLHGEFRKLMLGPIASKNAILFVRNGFLPSEKYINTLYNVHEQDRYNIVGKFKIESGYLPGHITSESVDYMIPDVFIVSKKVLSDVVTAIISTHPTLTRDYGPILFSYYFKKIFKVTPVNISDSNYIL